MTGLTAEELRHDFLRRLDAAMAQLPHGVASEIHHGVEEELTGLDADATAARLARLGDPHVIAREAQAEVPAAGSVVGVPSGRDESPKEKPLLTDTRGYAIAAALVFAFGGFVVPAVGWLVGVVLVSSSALWRRWEKVVAIALPFAVAVLIAVVTWTVRLVASWGAPADAEDRNPLMPTSLDLWHSSILLVAILIPVIGGWLLWRLRRR